MIAPPKKTWISPKIKIRQSQIDKNEMFAIEPIKTGEKVVVWGGKYVDKDEAKKAEQSGKLIMQWDMDLFSVEDRGDENGYFINHSCDPNVWMDGAFTLVACRNIEVGEEIFADYALWESDEQYISKWDCKCGFSICRKKITGKDWRLSVLQAKYRDHFSPLINKRIAQMFKS